MDDTERLAWLETQEGAALLSDDFGNWAVSYDGFQDIPDDPGQPSDINTTFFVKSADWYPTIRAAIDAARAPVESRTSSELGHPVARKTQR